MFFKLLVNVHNGGQCVIQGLLHQVAEFHIPVAQDVVSILPRISQGDGIDVARVGDIKNGTRHKGRQE